MSGTFAPITAAGGFTSFTESTETGWHQLDIPGPLLPVMAGTTPPDGAQGMLVYATTAVRYCFSPTTADLGATTYMELAAGQSLFVPGQTWVRNFCVLLGNGAQFSIQFTVGDIGPTPELSGGGGGGIIPPPPPGIGALPTQNVVHVMKNGNDATGTRNRLDLPFLTITAANTAMQTGDMMVIWPGYYEEGNITMVQQATYNLLGAHIFMEDGSVFIMPSFSEASIIGNGKIENAPSTSLPTIDHVSEASFLTIHGPAITNFGIGDGIRWGNGPLRCYSDVTVNDGYCINAWISFEIGGADIVSVGKLTGGNGMRTTVFAKHEHHGPIQVFGNGAVCEDGAKQYVYGDIAAGVAAITSVQTGTTFGEQYVSGNVSGQVVCNQGKQMVVGEVTNATVECNAGQQVVHGNVLVQSGIAVQCNGGVQVVVGNATALDGSAAYCAAGTQTIYGDCTGSTAGNGVESDDAAAIQTIFGNVSGITIGARNRVGSQVIYGNVTGGLGAICIDKQIIHGTVTGTVKPAAFCQGGVQVVYGVCVGIVEHGAFCESGTQSIYGPCSSDGSLAVVTCKIGSQSIYGDVTGAAPLAAECNGGLQVVHGNIDGVIAAAVTITGIQHLRGTVTTQNPLVCYGSMRIAGRVVSAANEAVVVEDGATLTLDATAVLVSQGTETIVEVSTGACTVVSLGAWSNLPASGAITVDGTLTVAAFVQ
jgi:hypothetical protein